VTAIDTLFTESRLGNPEAFAEWAGRVERPVRASLGRFARAVDIEVVMQETLLRMWVLAAHTDRSFEGENASLRVALGVARNVAREELRRARRDEHLPLEDVEDESDLHIDPEPGPDPGLARAIRECLRKLPKRLQAALTLRIDLGAMYPDRDLAERLGLKLNTFLQHIVRARKGMAECLHRKGVELSGGAS
jgi:DNA-directed RNA polymerase specialized sigma24 family protein